MKGDGSIFETRDRAGRVRWVAAVIVPGRASPVRRWLPAGATSAQAKQVLRQLRDERARGELDPKLDEAEPDPLPTMATAAAEWIAAGYPGGRKNAGANLRTLRGYDDMIRLRLVPHRLGSIRIDQVRRRDVAEFLADQAATGASRSLVQKLKNMVGRIYRHAQLVHEEHIGDRANPADVELPTTKATAKRRALTAKEIKALLTEVAGDRLLSGWLRLGIDTGMRPGEQAALTVGDLDLSAKPGTATVVKSIAWDPVDGRIVAREHETKTGELGNRRLTISKSTVSELREHRRRLAAERLATPGYWPDEQDGIPLGDRIFRRGDGLLVDHQYVGRRLAAAAERAGIGRVTPYDTRHTAATLMDELLAPGIAARALGHVVDHGSATTAGYIHRRITTVESAVLDLALKQAKGHAAGE